MWIHKINKFLLKICIFRTLFASENYMIGYRIPAGWLWKKGKSIIQEAGSKKKIFKLVDSVGAGQKNNGKGYMKELVVQGRELQISHPLEFRL